MTHFAVLVITDANTSVDDLMAPFQETDELFADGSRWDWYQVGGRWSGWLSGYNPDEDPKNKEVCRFCEGTGTTTAAVGKAYPAYAKRVGQQCIQCNGKGIVTSWPTQWVEHPGDVDIPIESINVATLEDLPTAVVTPSGEWHESSRVGWFGVDIPDEQGNGPKNPDDWRTQVIHLFDQHPGCRVTVLDCHI